MRKFYCRTCGYIAPSDPPYNSACPSGHVLWAYRDAIWYIEKSASDYALRTVIDHGPDVCAWWYPTPFGEQVRIQWPVWPEWAEQASHGPGRRLETDYFEQCVREALDRAGNEAVSRAIRTLRSLPVCPYSDRPVRVTWGQVSDGKTVGDRIDYVTAALVCDRCAEERRTKR